MIVGVPKEIKQDEYRVSLLPVGAEELTRAGHKVLVERGAGLGSGISDDLYHANGAEIVDSPAVIFGSAQLVIKVKEPQPEEIRLLRKGQTLFTYFHFAADEPLTRGVLETGITAVAYETLRGKHSDLPCLTPMSEVAGRMSIQEGAKFLERPQEDATNTRMKNRHRNIYGEYSVTSNRPVPADRTSFRKISLASDGQCSI